MPLLVYGALERDLRVTFITALILLGMAVIAFTITRWMVGLDSEERTAMTNLMQIDKPIKSNVAVPLTDASIPHQASELPQKARAN